MSPAPFRKAALYLLTALDAPRTPEMVLAVEIWARQESGNTIIGNNPWNLHSWGGLPGQDGYRNAGPGDRNVATFRTLEAGAEAAARNLLRQGYGYPAVVRAARAGDAEGFLEALAASSWSAGRYGTKNGGPNTLLAAYRRRRPQEDEMIQVEDATPMMASLPLGTRLYTPGGRLLTRLQSGGANVYSPFAVAGGRRAVVITTGGVRQLATFDTAAAAKLSELIPSDGAEREAWLQWLETHP